MHVVYRNALNLAHGLFLSVNNEVLNTKDSVIIYLIFE